MRLFGQGQQVGLQFKHLFEHVLSDKLLLLLRLATSETRIKNMGDNLHSVDAILRVCFNTCFARHATAIDVLFHSNRAVTPARKSTTRRALQIQVL